MLRRVVATHGLNTVVVFIRLKMFFNYWKIFLDCCKFVCLIFFFSRAIIWRNIISLMF